MSESRIRLDRLSESLEDESDIGAGRHLEKWGSRPRGTPESPMICGLEIPRAYNKERGELIG